MLYKWMKYHNCLLSLFKNRYALKIKQIRVKQVPLTGYFTEPEESVNEITNEFSNLIRFSLIQHSF